MIQTVHDAIRAADAILPGNAVSDRGLDPRWQAIVAIGEFIDSDPEPVWSFIERWGTSPDRDLRMAIATCLLEHLLEHHFDAFIVRIERAAVADDQFARTVASCWLLGDAEHLQKAERLNRIVAGVQRDSEPEQG